MLDAIKSKSIREVCLRSNSIPTIAKILKGIPREEAKFFVEDKEMSKAFKKECPEFYKYYFETRSSNNVYTHDMVCELSKLKIVDKFKRIMDYDTYLDYELIKYILIDDDLNVLTTKTFEIAQRRGCIHLVNYLFLETKLYNK
jgi:hypothetical protein